MKCLLGKHSKRIKLFEYSNLYLCLFFHYIIQGSLCSQRDHEKVMLKDSGVQNYTFGLGPVGLRTRLVASKYAFACYHVTQRNRRGGGGFKMVWRCIPFPYELGDIAQKISFMVHKSHESYKI